ncbi:MAG: hypothetical protein K2Q97_17185 [Burkholderiaceae bacterium]|nr:hypothetical protein [Burkholderiaceae bacterium]
MSFSNFTGLLTLWVLASASVAQAQPAPAAISVLEAQPAAMVAKGCRALTDQAMTVDFKAVTAQANRIDLTQQVQLLEQTVGLWTQAASECDGRAKERALRSLDDNTRMLSRLSEKLDSGPQCTAAHKNATSLQDIARHALAERRWQDSAALFRKAENMWDLAAERCTGTQQASATERRSQSEIDGHNAEFCAPVFESARDATQKLRAGANTLTREQKQNDSLVAETLWRKAVDTCKGAAVKDTANNNAVALARQRGTPWIATVAAAAPLSVAANASALGTNAPVANIASMSALAAAAASNDTASGQAVAPAVAGTYLAGSTQFVGQFARDADGLTYSGTGKVVWVTGEVFEGTMIKGLRQGKGVMTWANGQRYDGDWVSDQSTGQARMHFANGNDYEGRVQNGVPEGQGRMRYASGDSFEGQFKAGEPDGSGVYAWKNGQSYSGQWQNTRPNGQGKLKFSNGNQYEGRVVNGTPNGTGRLVFATGEVYFGQFFNGDPHGEGTFVWSSGDQYTGQWKAGKKHGKGVYQWKSGDRWEGVYDNDNQTAADSPASKG